MVKLFWQSGGGIGTAARLQIPAGCAQNL